MPRTATSWHRALNVEHRKGPELCVVPLEPTNCTLSGGEHGGIERGEVSVLCDPSMSPLFTALAPSLRLSQTGLADSRELASHPLEFKNPKA